MHYLKLLDLSFEFYSLIVCISTKEPSCVGLACRAKLRFGYPSTSAVFGLIFRALYFPFHDRVLFYVPFNSHCTI